MLTGGTPGPIGRFVFYAVMICWCLFAVTFIARRRPARRQETRRDWTAMVGFLIQSAGYFVIWLRPLQRTRFSPLLPMSNVAELALAALTLSIAVFSVWLVNAAVRTLGAQEAKKGKAAQATPTPPMMEAALTRKRRRSVSISSALMQVFSL